MHEFLESGMEVYLVGGRVRDQIMGKAYDDTDRVITGADTQFMNHYFGNSIGRGFPVWLDELDDEWALARKEKSTGPRNSDFDFVTAGVTLAEDLYRRDFTFNAMAVKESESLWLEPSRGKPMDASVLVDPYNGLKDLNNKIIRHVSLHFKEDPLRVLRAARFLARFHDFKVHPDTIALCTDMVRNGDLKHLPADRFWKETQKALLADAPWRYFKFLADIGFLPQVDSRDLARLRLVHKRASLSDMPPQDRALVCYAAVNSYNQFDEYLFPPNKMKEVSGAATRMREFSFDGVNTMYSNMQRVGVFKGDLVTLNYVFQAAAEPIVQSFMQDIAAKCSRIEIVDMAPGPEYGQAILAKRKEIIQQMNF